MLNVLSWNVAGWSRCLTQSADIPFFRQSFDIIALQETWTAATLKLDGYYAFVVKAVPGRGPGRLKGGLSILISTTVKVNCKELPPLKQLAMAVLISWKKDCLLIINCYLPPTYKKPEIEKIWQALEHYVRSLILEYPQARVLVMGDLNARRGPNDSSLASKYRVRIDNQEDLEPFCQSWSSKDQRSNYAGICLIRFAMRLNLFILNGSNRGDIPGEYTFMAGAKTSTIDYMLVDRILLSQTVKFQILPYLEGDHLPLSLQVHINGEALHLTTSYPADVSLLERPGSGVKWSPLLESRIKEILTVENLHLLCQIIEASLNMQQPLEVYEDLIEKLRPLLFNNRNQRPYKVKSMNKPWFDQNCIKAKNILNNAYKNALTAEKEVRQEAYISLLEIKKKYKTLISNCKKAHTRKL